MSSDGAVVVSTNNLASTMEKEAIPEKHLESGPLEEITWKQIRAALKHTATIMQEEERSEQADRSLDSLDLHFRRTCGQIVKD